MGTRRGSALQGLGASITNHRVPDTNQRHSPELGNSDHVHRRSFLAAISTTVLTVILGREIGQSEQVTQLKFGYGGAALPGWSERVTTDLDGQTTDFDGQTTETIQEYGKFGYGGITEKSE